MNTRGLDDGNIYSWIGTSDATDTMRSVTGEILNYSMVAPGMSQAIVHTGADGI